MPTQVPTGEGVPSVFYRNAIDLNRFSNGIARKLAQENVNVIVRAVEQLKKIDESKGPSYKAARLRSLIKQTKKTLSTWQEKSVDVMIKDLESVAKVQAGFVEDQLKKALPAGMQKQIVEEIGYSVQSVAVSPGFAKAVVTNTPTKFNLGQAGKFNLTAKQGAEVLLPNGETISKAFRGLATKQANQFNQIVRTGLLSGEPTPDIVRQLVGNLDFGEKARTIKQLNMAGGEVTKLATHQINTIVRTSVNQVSNAASQSVYKANKKITKEYRYLSTLDSKTSPVCRSLDGQIFAYGKGPEPPQHFGCRSTTVPVIDYKGNGWPAPPSVTTAKRASVDGPVPANTTYGKWLYDKRKPGTKFTPGPEQIKVLGTQKAKYFNRLSNKYGPDEAMKKFMREDNSETSLATLQKRYGKPEDIKAKVRKKKAAAPKVTTPPVKPSPAIKKIDKEIAETKKQLQEAKAQLKALEERDPSLPTIAQLQGISPTGKVKANEVNKAFDLMDQMEGLAGENARKLRKFAEKKQVFCNWSNAKEGNLRSSKQKYEYFLDNPQLKKTIQTSLKNETTYGFSDVYRDMDAALKTNDFRFVSYEAKRYFTAGGKGRKYMNGMTIKGANHIVLKATSKQKAIKNLKKMQDDIKDAVKYAKNNQKNPNWDRNNYWSAHGKGRFDESTTWLKTYVHEMGHQVHYTNAVNKLNSYDWIPSAYGSSDYKERFAETFVQFIFSPVELKKASPSAYKWIEDTIDASLKKVDKWT